MGASSSPWQARYWEHTIRDDADLRRHVDYVHINPVKHALVARVADWPHSSFRRYVDQGLLPVDWAGTAKLITGVSPCNLLDPGRRSAPGMSLVASRKAPGCASLTRATGRIQMHPALLILLALIVALILWRVVARKDSAPETTIQAPPINPLSASDIATIEAALAVTLPPDYARFLQAERPEAIDETSVRDDAELIIGFTREYRDSSQWPAHLVWIGDEADASPRVLDCISGEVFRVEKGNLRKAWDRHPSFSAFVAAKLRA